MEENKNTMMVTSQVSNVKHILCNSNSEFDKLKALRSLQFIRIPAHTIRTTNIGSVVTQIKSSSESMQIRELAETLLTKWLAVLYERPKEDVTKIATEKVINKGDDKFVQKDNVSKYHNKITLRIKCEAQKHQPPQNIDAEAQITKAKMEQKKENLLVTKNKNDQVRKDEEFTCQAKLEGIKRKLHDGYERIKKKQRTIKIIELKDLPQSTIANRCQAKSEIQNVHQRIMKEVRIA